MKRTWTFDNGRSGFRYADDAFLFTDEPRYARGSHDDSGALIVRLGGRDDAVVHGMSGGWTRGFELDEAQSVTLTFRVKMKQGPDHSAREFADVRVLLDGEPVEVAGRNFAVRLMGDGVGGPDRSMGWRTIEVDLGPMAAGRHEFTLGGYSNRKTSQDAFTRIVFDDVSIEGTPPPRPRLAAFEAEVLRLTNTYREKYGLDALKNDANLNAAAEDWSREMANGDFFRHSNKPSQITEHGYDPDGWGENIAAGYQTPKEVVKGWINSPGHRANLLSDDFEHIGIGYAYKSNDGGQAPYGHYWTQIFGAPDDDYVF